MNKKNGISIITIGLVFSMLGTSFLHARAGNKKLTTVIWETQKGDEATFKERTYPTKLLKKSRYIRDKLKKTRNDDSIKIDLHLEDLKYKHIKTVLKFLDDKHFGPFLFPSYAPFRRYAKKYFYKTAPKILANNLLLKKPLNLEKAIKTTAELLETANFLQIDELQKLLILLEDNLQKRLADPLHLIDEESTEESIE